jgi:hypothetical protein
MSVEVMIMIKLGLRISGLAEQEVAGCICEASADTALKVELTPTKISQ